MYLIILDKKYFPHAGLRLFEIPIRVYYGAGRVFIHQAAVIFRVIPTAPRPRLQRPHSYNPSLWQLMGESRVMGMKIYRILFCTFLTIFSCIVCFLLCPFRLPQL